ncbi:MAG: hypothetical protein ACOY94_28425 [Bacillota bacterium]
MGLPVWLRGTIGLVAGGLVGVAATAILAVIAIPLGWPIFYGDDHQKFLIYVGALSVVLKALWAVYPALGFWLLMPAHPQRTRNALIVLGLMLVLTWFLPWPSVDDF